ncbi:MAG TPA: hypothetical protein DD726_08595 [Phycisphaerales bacterium]|nr:hypothetical protein [Phycisphaerales bacterium]
MELVANNSVAIAVTDELTTLIDWTNIEAVSGFTVMVENAGGGGANSITDIQIDTSNDGGTTPALDQFAGVPAVPITSGNTKTGTFTSTAKFVRIRAICAAGEDTTANAWLNADSSIGRICTLADVKDRLGITNTENDLTINTIIASLAALFDTYCNRNLIVPAADVTEYYTGYSQWLQLRRYPIVSITSIKTSYNFDFTSATALIADTDYRIVEGGRKGMLVSLYGTWPLFVPDAIQVIYLGGYAAAGATLTAGQTALPGEIREAAIEQASFIFKRRMDIGLSAQSFDGGSINKFSDMDLLPLVKQVLDMYKRTVL